MRCVGTAACVCVCVWVVLSCYVIHVVIHVTLNTGVEFSTDQQPDWFQYRTLECAMRSVQRQTVLRSFEDAEGLRQFTMQERDCSDS